MRETMMLLAGHSKVSDYKFNTTKKESYELFFVKGALETMRCTDTCDKEVTVYVNHGDFKGDSKFFIYPSTTFSQKADLVMDAVKKAQLIENRYYDLPGSEGGEFNLETNFTDYDPADLAAAIARTVFEAGEAENAGLNAVEIFINKYTETVQNSRGLYKTQVRYDAMVEAIPTYNGAELSVELYEQYNFGALDVDALRAEIAGKMAEVKARFEAITPTETIDCKVILKAEELGSLFSDLSRNLNYQSVYNHSNVFSKGDAVQKAPRGDKLTITMAGSVPGNVASSAFDSDGLSLDQQTIVADGVAVGYYGSNAMGQYLGETPTGSLRCLCVAPGTAVDADFETGPYLEVVSMSGLQVDFYADYIGGEVRLAYWHDGEKVTPVSGISFSGSVADAFNSIRLSDTIITQDRYTGPKKAILEGMKIY